MFRLSVEELAFAMGFLGGSDVAAGFLEAAVGKQNTDNVSGRITAASHSLLARELLTLDLSDNTNELRSDLAALVKIMLSTDRSVRCQSLGAGEDRVLTCFMSDGAMVAHELEMGVVAKLEAIKDIAHLKNKIMSFIQPPEDKAASNSIGRLSGDALQRVRQLIARGEMDKARILLGESLPEAVVQMLADDLAHDDVAWGTVLLVETAPENSDTPLESNNGVLYASTPRNLWLFQFVPNDMVNVNVFEGSAGQLRLLLDQMMSQLS